MKQYNSLQTYGELQKNIENTSKRSRYDEIRASTKITTC